MTVEERSYAAYRKLNLIFGFSGHFVFPFGGLSNRRNTLITEKAVNPGGQERYEGVTGYDSNEESYNITTILPCLYIFILHKL